MNLFLSGISAIAKIHLTESEIDVIKEDPDDNMFLACALDSEAEYILFRDKHLLDLGSYKGIKIITPKEFFKKVIEEKIDEY